MASRSGGDERRLGAESPTPGDGKRECFISLVVSLLDVTTATQQFTVSGYVSAVW